MSTPRALSPQGLMVKAENALASAKLLSDAGDIDGACNRAYYAMFDAAKAVYWQLCRRLTRKLAKPTTV